MTLAALLSALNIPADQWPEGAADCIISGVTADSRAVSKNFVFIAVPGVRADGMLFAEMAVEKGASVVMGERAPDAPLHAAFIKIGDARAALSKAAAGGFFHASDLGCAGAGSRSTRHNGRGETLGCDLRLSHHT
jgi:UDP-N-acetylmuramyl pentapeptide synthase